ncbi:MAG: signal peptidase I [Sphingomicrobium sp.]
MADTAPSAPAPSTAVPSRAKPQGSTLGSLLRLAIFAWLLRALLLEPFYIPSGSMLPTMAIGDYLFVEKWPYGYSRFSFPWHFPPINGRWFAALPARGDVIVFKPPSSDHDSWVKRVIGLPGDTIEVRDGALILNGAPIKRESTGEQPVPLSPNSPCRTIGAAPQEADGSCLYPAYHETLPGGRSYLTLDQADVPVDHFGPVTVPAGDVFVMGDNRDDSEDSRFSAAEGGVGLLPVERIIGRAGHIFWSTDGSASYALPWTWFSALRTERIGSRY